MEEGAARNKLLASMERPALLRLVRAVELVALRPAAILCRSDAPLSHAYFPVSGLISLAAPGNGKLIEAGMVGREGFVGLPLLFGVGRCPMTAITQVGGHAMRISADLFQNRFRREPGLASVLGRYAYAFMAMLAQGSACNSAHSVEQRCARWLLTAYDRLDGAELPVTQAELAHMLGVRRPSVSEVAERLQRRHFIRYGQGRITVLDRHGLESIACPCYAIVRREFERVRLK